MRLKESVEEGIAILAMEGEIDLHYAPVLRSLLQGKVKEHCPALVLDLAGVTFIDSAGLAAIVEYFRDASRYEGVLCLTGLNEDLRTVFEIVRLDQVIPVFSTNARSYRGLEGGECSSSRRGSLWPLDRRRLSVALHARLSLIEPLEHRARNSASRGNPADLSWPSTVGQYRARFSPPRWRSCRFPC